MFKLGEIQWTFKFVAYATVGWSAVAGATEVTEHQSVFLNRYRCGHTEIQIKQVEDLCATSINPVLKWQVPTPT